jgi:hypothetical protein
MRAYVSVRSRVTRDVTQARTQCPRSRARAALYISMADDAAAPAPASSAPGVMTLTVVSQSHGNVQLRVKRTTKMSALMTACMYVRLLCCACARLCVCVCVCVCVCAWAPMCAIFRVFAVCYCVWHVSCLVVWDVMICSPLLLGTGALCFCRAARM